MNCNHQDNHNYSYILFVKDKGISPFSSELVKTVFIFRTPSCLFNTVFQRNIINRFQKWTFVTTLHDTQIHSLYSIWSDSQSSDNTIADSLLPFPNTKTYVWDSHELNYQFQQLRNSQSLPRNSTNRNRYNIYSLKKMCIPYLLKENCVVLEMTVSLLNHIMNLNHILFLWKFKIDHTIKQHELNTTDYISHLLHDFDYKSALHSFTSMDCVVNIVYDHPYYLANVNGNENNNELYSNLEIDVEMNPERDIPLDMYI